MCAKGTFPTTISLLTTLDSIGETILIADTSYRIVWFNEKAEQLLTQIAPLYGLNKAEEMIGQTMDRFHSYPSHQQQVMKQLSETHRARITIQNRFVSDIVVTPIQETDNSVQGYVVMLMDVTTKAEEDRQKEKLIQSLSVPLLTVWENTLALPLIGEFDKDRAERLMERVLEACASEGIHYVLIDLSGIYSFDGSIKYEIQKLSDALRLIGTECVFVGISPELAMSTGELGSRTHVFGTAYAGLQYIIKKQKSLL